MFWNVLNIFSQQPMCVCTLIIISVFVLENTRMNCYYFGIISIEYNFCDSPYDNVQQKAYFQLSSAG